MQPLGKPAAGGDVAAAASAAAEPGSTAFAALAAADVKPDAVFFHKFYSSKEARKPAAATPRGDADSDSSDSSDDEIGELSCGVMLHGRIVAREANQRHQLLQCLSLPFAESPHLPP